MLVMIHHCVGAGKHGCQFNASRVGVRPHTEYVCVDADRLAETPAGSHNNSCFIAENRCLVIKMSTNSSEDLNTQVLIGECSSVLRQVQIDSDHLFRHLTEVNGKDTRVSVKRGRELIFVISL